MTVIPSKFLGAQCRLEKLWEQHLDQWFHLLGDQLLGSRQYRGPAGVFHKFAHRTIQLGMLSVQEIETDPST